MICFKIAVTANSPALYGFVEKGIMRTFMFDLSLIKEFQQAFQKDYGKAISDEEAAMLLENMVTYFMLLKKMCVNSSIGANGILLE